MLIVDIYTLETVYSLYFLDHIILYCTQSLDSQDIMRINTTFRQLVSGLQLHTVLNLDSGTVRNQVCLGFSCLIVGDNNLTLLLCIVDRCGSRKLCDDCKSLRLSCLEKLLDTRKTLRDIVTGNSTRMESTHRKLCTRLTDRLCGDDSDRLSNLDWFTCCHVCSITLRTDAKMRFTGQDRTDLHLLDFAAVFIHTFCDDRRRTLRCNHVVCLYNDISFTVADRLTGVASCDTLLKALNLFVSIRKCFDIHTRNFFSFGNTVYFTDRKLLGNVNKTSCQVSGVGCTKSRIRKTFTCSMGRHEVFQYVQTFTEVGLDRQLDSPSCRICHQTTHTGKLFDLLVRTTGSGIRHHKDIVVFIQTGKQGLCQGIVCCFPCLYDFFVTLFFGNQTTLKVPCNLIHRILCLLDHLRLLRRYRHIRNRYRHRCPCGELVSNGFYIVKYFCCRRSAVGIDYLLQDLL